MNSHEFYLWLNGYLEALESEGIEVCKIKNIREKMSTTKNHYQERVVFSPNVNANPQNTPYAKPPTPTANKGI